MWLLVLVSIEGHVDLHTKDDFHYCANHNNRDYVFPGHHPYWQVLWRQQHNTNYKTQIKRGKHLHWEQCSRGPVLPPRVRNLLVRAEYSRRHTHARTHRVMSGCLCCPRMCCTWWNSSVYHSSFFLFFFFLFFRCRSLLDPSCLHTVFHVGPPGFRLPGATRAGLASPRSCTFLIRLNHLLETKSNWRASAV